MRAVVEGLLAGWAIAIPVGAIGVLIVDRAATRGFPTGAAAALGTAAADLFYAVVAVAVGGAVAAVLPAPRITQTVSAVVLLLIGLWLLRMAVARPGAAKAVAPARSPWATTATFFSLTVINPVTVVYFAALIASLDTTVLNSGADRALFAGAAFVASLSWQLLLAGFGAFAHHALPETAGRWLRIIGALAVVAFGVRAAVQALG